MAKALCLACTAKERQEARKALYLKGTRAGQRAAANAQKWRDIGLRLSSFTK
jgi:hypothetical protein